jgi:hypothetical protein
VNVKAAPALVKSSFFEATPLKTLPYFKRKRGKFFLPRKGKLKLAHPIH